MYWGPITAGIDWCETNYSVSPFVAEFWNTVSSLWMVVIATMGIVTGMFSGSPWRFEIAYFLLAVIGLGSVLFHGMMTRTSQLSDELPMVWLMMSLLYIFFMDRTGGKWPLLSAIAFFTYGSVSTAALLWSSHPLAFQMPFVAGTFGMMYSQFQKVPSNKDEDILLQLSWSCFFPSMLAWPVERLLCQTWPSVELLCLHSWWHIYIALALHMQLQSANVSYMCCNGMQWKVKYVLFGSMPIAWRVPKRAAAS